MTLGLVESDCSLVKPFGDEIKSTDIIRDAVSKTNTILFVREYLKQSSDVSGANIGAAVSERFGIDWSVSSMKRTGGALRNWVLWLEGKRQVGRGRRPGKRDYGSSLGVSETVPSLDRLVAGFRGSGSLSVEQMVEISQLWRSGYTLKQLAKTFGVSEGTVWKWKTQGEASSSSS